MKVKDAISLASRPVDEIKMPKPGRPVGSRSDLIRYGHEARLYIAQQIEKNIGGIVAALMAKALQGDVNAVRELFDRAHGKSMQALEVSGKDGQPIVFMPLELINKHALQDAESIAKQNAIEGTAEIKSIDNVSVKP